jgi:hypothetical protein
MAQHSKPSESSKSSKKETSESKPKRKSGKIILYIVIALLVLMLCCITSIGVSVVFFRENVETYLEEYDINVSQDREDETDTDNSSDDSNSQEQDDEENGDADDSQDNGQSDSSSDEADQDGSDDEPVVEEWIVKEFSLEVPLTDKMYNYTLEIPDFADWYVGSDSYSVYSSEPYFSLSIYTVPEAYGVELESANYLFRVDGFGDVYRVKDSISDQNFYSNDITTDGTCEILGSTVPAPCGPEAMIHNPSGGFFVAMCSSDSDDGLYYCDEVIRSIEFSVEE